MNSFDRNEYVRVAHYYYRQGMTQDEIAKKLNTSRVRVNRILNRCRELGIVRIHIMDGAEEHLELESRLEQAYGLKDVRLAETDFDEDIYAKVGLVAADYLAKQVQDGDIIAFSRGRALSNLLDSLPRLEQENLQVTQLMGGWNYHRTPAAAHDVAGRFAERSGAEVNYMYAPVLVHNKKFKEAIWEEPSFLETYDMIRRCRIAVVGVGQVEEEPDFLGGDPEIQRAYGELLAQGAVGEICAHYFDRQGSSMSGDFDDKVIAVALPDYLHIPLRIGIACGAEKAQALLGAVRGGYINVLICDLASGQQLWEAAMQNQKG